MPFYHYNKGHCGFSWTGLFSMIVSPKCWGLQILAIVAVVFATVALAHSASAQGVDRGEIQRFFVGDRGNSVRTEIWRQRFQGQPVSWSGEVYKVEEHPESARVEVLVKVLPDAVLYDTVVILEGNTRLPGRLDRGTWVRFSGKVINGVDAFGVKEVQVLLPSPANLQVTGVHSSSPDEY